jgi:hypothetical protein
MCRDDIFFIFKWNLFLRIPYVEILDPPLHVYVFLAFASEKKRHGDKLKGVYVFLVRLSVQLYTDCFLVRGEMFSTVTQSNHLLLSAFF